MNKKSLAYIACALALFGCEDYNELNFEGYKDLAVPTDVKSINYTLKKADYADLFKLAANKTVAESTITENADGTLDSTMYDAFFANASNSYFTDLVPAELYLPAFLADKWSTATDGSSAIITVNELVETPELHQQIMDAYDYELSEYDYEMVWEEDEEAYEYFCPSHSASKYINRILKDNFDDAEAGEVVLVRYQYAESNPATSGNEEEGEVKYDAISDIFENGVGEYSICGTVVATYARGYLINDGTGYILYYAGNTEGAKAGDMIAVSGAVTEYAGLPQFGNTATLKVISSGNKVTHPTPRVLSATDMDAMIAAPKVEYVSYTGTLNISGNYYNINIDGAETAIGSIQYPAEGLVDTLLNKKQVTVTGYFIGVSSGKYFNTMATSVTAADAVASAPRRAAAEAATTTVFALYQWDGTAWKEIKDMDIVQPTEYTAMGMSSNAISDPATYVPLYLSKNYPYAVNKQKTTLVYFNKNNSIVVEEYLYDGTAWSTTGLEEGIYNFNLIEGQWVYKTFKCIPVTEVTESGLYVMVADIRVNEETGATEGRLFSPLGENKNYGYMPYASVAIDDEGIIKACDAAENAFLTLTAVEEGFTMQDTYGRYIYMKGDYNSFNIGTEEVQPGSTWQFILNEEGTFSVTNTMNGKVIMYDTQYTSYGCYPAKTDPRLYVSVFKVVE